MWRKRLTIILAEFSECLSVVFLVFFLGIGSLFAQEELKVEISHHLDQADMILMNLEPLAVQRRFAELENMLFQYEASLFGVKRCIEEARLDADIPSAIDMVEEAIARHILTLRNVLLKVTAKEKERVILCIEIANNHRHFLLEYKAKVREYKVKVRK